MKRKEKYMNNLMNSFVEQYKVLFNAENKQKYNKYNFTWQTLLNTMFIMITMIFLFALMGYIFNLLKNIQYLFYSTNAALLTTLIYLRGVYLMHLQKQQNDLNIKVGLLLFALKIVMVQITIYILLIYVYWLDMANFVNVIILITVNIIIFSFLLTIDIKSKLSKYRLSVKTFLLAGINYIIFVLIMYLLKIQNITYLYISVTLLLYGIEFVFIILKRQLELNKQFDNYLRIIGCVGLIVLYFASDKLSFTPPVTRTLMKNFTNYSEETTIPSYFPNYFLYEDENYYYLLGYFGSYSDYNGKIMIYDKSLKEIKTLTVSNSKLYKIDNKLYVFKLDEYQGDLSYENLAPIYNIFTFDDNLNLRPNTTMFGVDRIEFPTRLLDSQAVFYKLNDEVYLNPRTIRDQLYKYTGSMQPETISLTSVLNQHDDLLRDGNNAELIQNNRLEFASNKQVYSFGEHYLLSNNLVLTNSSMLYSVFVDGNQEQDDSIMDSISNQCGQLGPCRVLISLNDLVNGQLNNAIAWQDKSGLSYPRGLIVTKDKVYVSNSNYVPSEDQKIYEFYKDGTLLDEADINYYSVENKKVFTMKDSIIIYNGEDLLQKLNLDDISNTLIIYDDINLGTFQIIACLASIYLIKRSSYI
jgi:hypothetical protein